jgi:DNA-directed RNA polymerase subunit N (RpoN/RPB10)
VTCRKERVSDCCGKHIKPDDGMYMQSMFDYAEAKPATPYFLCEPCGDMALNLFDIGFCFNLGEDIVQQWREYQKKINAYQSEVNEFLLLCKKKNLTIKEVYDNSGGFLKNRVPYNYFYEIVMNPLKTLLDTYINNIIYQFWVKHNNEKSP